MIKVNKDIQNLKPSATLAINQKVNLLRSEGKHIYHFGFGQSPFPIHQSIVYALQENATNNHYLPTIGLNILRMQIAKFLKENQLIEADSDFIFIGPGSKELLYQTILILDSVFLIPKGSWVSYGPQINSKNGEYEILETSLENDFKLSSNTLETYCKAHPNQQKTLILNSPNNPTGAVYTNEELERLAKVCRANNIIVLSDEIYYQINFTEDFSPSMSTFYPEKTIVFGGLSKVFSAGGYRLGFMALPKDLEFLYNTYRSLFSETFSAVSSPIQYAAIEAFKMKPDLVQHIKISSSILKNISHYVFTKLIHIGIECTKPCGAFYLMIGFNKFREQLNALNINTSEQLSNYILENYQVALLPASDFYFEKKEFFFRLAFVDFDGESILKATNDSTEIDENFIKLNAPNMFKGIQRLTQLIKDLSIK